MPTFQEMTDQNRRAWDEIAQARHADQFPDAAFFRNGGSTLHPREVAAAGDVKGRTLLHLQCSTGSDTLSWGVLGARATGVDISERQIAIARSNAGAAGLDVQFVAADVIALPAELQQGTFEMVYTGGGALVWVPDITLWANSVAAALCPGGRLILSEEHPLMGCVLAEGGVLKIIDDYFGRHTPFVGTGWGHFRGGEEAQEVKYEFVWPLGDVITALAQAGLMVERLEEFPSSAEWRFGDQLEKVTHIPGEFLLIARKL